MAKKTGRINMEDSKITKRVVLQNGIDSILIANRDFQKGDYICMTDADLSNEFGFALQAGFDIPIEEAGFGVSVDVKRYFIGTDATVRVGDDEIIRTKHNLDPWTISAGLTFIL